MRVVVIIVIDTSPIDRARRRVALNEEEMRMDLACESMVRVIRIRMNVLKWCDEKRQQQCQNRLHCRRPPHH